MKTIVLVPVKSHTHVKSRMAPALTLRERSLLARAMLEDLITALRALSMRTPIAFLTGSDLAAARARDFGWRVLMEKEQISESHSVDRASKHLDAEGYQGVLRLPADVPLVEAADIEELLAYPLQPRMAVLVPSRDSTGTNAILRRPPTLFPSRFGNNSLVLHVQEASRAQGALRVVRNENLALDLDDPSDILAFMERSSDTQTQRFLENLRLEERLVSHAP